MRKHLLWIWICLSAIVHLPAQERMMVHNGGLVVYEALVGEIDSVTFYNNRSILHLGDAMLEFALSAIDSITFATEPVGPDERTVYITYNDNDITVVNPFAGNGIEVSLAGGHVSVTATAAIDNVVYSLSGNTTDGSFAISGDRAIGIVLNGLSVVNPSGAAISISGTEATTIQLVGNNNSLSDGSVNAAGATVVSGGDILFNGTGSLTVRGCKKHGISGAKTIKVFNGALVVAEAASDGLHSEGFIMEGGSLEIVSLGDGIDAGAGTIDIRGGTVKVTSTEQDVKALKADGTITVDGGVVALTVSGAQSKGFSSKADVVFNGGVVDISTSGATVLEASGSGYDPSYCTAVKTKGSIVVNNGTINITSASSCDGGKGLSADEDIIINNGTITIATAGNGATYTNEEGAKDSYTSCCIKCDGNMSIVAGHITCRSSGTGGKGIASDGTLTIGSPDADDTDLILDVTTSGERFYVSGSGDNADYANPKAVKSEGNLTVHSGVVTINCTQKNEGGEGLESKATLTIGGGVISISSYDDSINASDHIEISGGTMYFVATGNDAVDSNGTLSISGGFIIANGARAPEGGFDCDQSRFAITGGVIIGTGGSSSTPTSNACTQPSVVYSNATAGNALCIKNSDGDIILLYTLPTLTGSGGGGPGGGNGMTLLFSDPAFTTGSYTLQYGGSISGGTTVNGYNTGGTYTGGSSKNFTISGMVTRIN